MVLKKALNFISLCIILTLIPKPYLYPFYLEGVASVPGLNLEDGLHPNERGVAIIVKNLMPHVKKLIKQIKK